MASDVTLPIVNGWYAYRDDNGNIQPVCRDKVGPTDDKPWFFPTDDVSPPDWIRDEDMIRNLQKLEDPHLYSLRLGKEVR